MQIIDSVLEYAKQNDIPLNSLEALYDKSGWREFIRGIYVAKGTEEKSKFFRTNEKYHPLFMMAQQALFH